MTSSKVSFRSVLRGYDPTQVEHHMNELALAAASQWQETNEHTRLIEELKAANSRLSSEAESNAQRARVLEDAQREAVAPTYTGLGERIGSVLTLVDNEVVELRTRAEADAANSRGLAEENALATGQAAQEHARHPMGLDVKPLLVGELVPGSGLVVGGGRFEAVMQDVKRCCAP
jgi:hypothetical protein